MDSLPLYDLLGLSAHFVKQAASACNRMPPVLTAVSSSHRQQPLIGIRERVLH